MKEEYVYVLQLKANHQESKIPFTEFWWLGPYNIEKVLPNNNYLVRKIDTNKTQVLHRMQMRKFTSHQVPADIRTTPQEWKPDPEVSFKHDDLYARAWEYDFEQPNFDAGNNNTDPPNSLDVPIQSGLSTEEMRNTTGTARECSPEIFPQREELGTVTYTYPHKEHDVEASSEQPNKSPTNPRSSKYNISHSRKPNCNDGYR